jgi:hypothetical protein
VTAAKGKSTPKHPRQAKAAHAGATKDSAAAPGARRHESNPRPRAHEATDGAPIDDENEDLDSEEFRKSLAESIATSVVVKPGSNRYGIKLYRDLHLRPSHDLVFIAEDPRWTPARDHSEFAQLWEAAGLAVQVLGKVAAGLELANNSALHPSDREVFQDYVKTAKAVNARLKDLCLPLNGENVPRLWKLPLAMNQRSAVKDCVPAWQEALRLIRAKAKSTNASNIEKVVNDVIAAKPELVSRLRLEKAKENSSKKTRGVFEMISEGLVGRKVPREAPFELAARACGLPSAEAARHLFYSQPTKRKRP